MLGTQWAMRSVKSRGRVFICLCTAMWMTILQLRGVHVCSVLQLRHRCVLARPGVMEHGLSTFVRLVRAILGQCAIADTKVECGMDLVILGIRVQSGRKGARFTLCPEKAEKWMTNIREAIVTSKLVAGSAQKLAGRLTFATQRLFHRLGRAMIKPVFAQVASGDGTVGPLLLHALRWWLVVLESDICESRPWAHVESKVCRLFVDAASTPPCCAAVLFIDGRSVYTALCPSQRFLRQLAARSDNQITSLVTLVLLALHYSMLFCVQEIIGILLAINTFQEELRGRKVIVYSDNKGSVRFQLQHLVPLHYASCGPQERNIQRLVGQPGPLTTISSCTRYGAQSSDMGSTSGSRGWLPNSTSAIILLGESTS